MSIYTKHTLFAMAVGYWIAVDLALGVVPSLVLGLILAALARLLSHLEEQGHF
jgi:hypothetical protein